MGHPPAPRALSVGSADLHRREDPVERIRAITPEPAEKSDLNLFTWRFTLPPGQKQTVQYEFSVEHPRALTLSGLNV